MAMELRTHACILLLVFVQLLLLCLSATTSGPETDRAALLAFKKAVTDDPQSVLHSWNSSLGVCQWAGVACRDTQHPGRVSYLDLGYTGIVGVLSPSIADLIHLTNLNLSGNSLSGDIPPSLRNLSSLKVLDLHSSKLRGEIPVSMGELPSLLYLDLSQNELNGGIPTSLGNLSSLRLLSLESNIHLSGAIPSELENLSTLRYLDLSNNNLSGEIPSSMGRILSLEFLGLSTNNLTGGIPDSFGNLINITYLDISHNVLIGPIPPSISDMSSLQTVDLSYNQLDGRIPEELGRFRNLVFFQVAFNQLSSDVPFSLFNITSLETVSLMDNKLSGSLPEEIGNTLPNLVFLSLASNQMEGSIPRSLTNATLLQVLDLSTNNFTGRIPTNLGNLQNLEYLSLGDNSLVARGDEDWEFFSSLAGCTRLEELNLMNNKLRGELPSTLANLSTQLTTLTLSGNQISGAFPLGIKSFVNLEKLGLEYNQFTGSIPDFLWELVNLESLSLRGNKFNGIIPLAVGNLVRLSELFLDRNELQGSIPASLGRCQNLNILDLSHNRFSGSIPEEVLSIVSLSNYIDLSNNYLTGTLPPEVGQLRNLQFLTFSNNRLSGKIPSNIEGCQVLEYLNLSSNSFEGAIPSTITNMRGLKMLDLSFNNLSGSIPEFLAHFADLKLLNLSFNDLVGEVPRDGVFENSTQFSVIGNSKVCGGISTLRLPPCSRNTSKKGFSLALKIALPITSATLLLSFFTYYLVGKRMNYSRARVDLERPLRTPEKVSYLDLTMATNNFSTENLIGVGSYASVYEGFLANDGRVVAVKVLNLRHGGASKAFLSECEALRNVRHRNLIKIITTCSGVDFQGNEFKAILFEFMPNGSLDDWLHPVPNEKLSPKKLSLVQRLDVAVDVAAALKYLHDYCIPPIVHCDLKPSNVLFDDNMTAHVGDFGIARFISDGTLGTCISSSMAIKGSIGYIAPEYGMGGHVTTQIDVYSYGVLLLELFTGRRPTDDLFKDGLTLQNYVAESLSRGVPVPVIADPSLSSEHGSGPSWAVEQCLKSVLTVAVSCAKESPKERFTMAEVELKMGTIKSRLLTTDL